MRKKTKDKKLPSAREPHKKLLTEILTMITAQSLLYSKSAIARMERVEVKDVVRLEVWANCIFIIIRGRRPRFYSKTAFQVHFVEWRKAQAKELQAFRNAFSHNIYWVHNQSKGTRYTVQMYPGGATCECEDFKNQMQFFGKACCKHIYRCLAQIGHNSLAEYIAA